MCLGVSPEPIELLIELDLAPSDLSGLFFSHRGFESPFLGVFGESEDFSVLGVGGSSWNAEVIEDCLTNFCRFSETDIPDFGSFANSDLESSFDPDF